MTISEFERSIHIPKVRIMDPTPEELIQIAEYFDVSLDVLVLKDLKKSADFDAKKIKLLILDADGTMTDGGMYFTENGDLIKKYNAKDGLAIKRLVKEGIHVGIISHGTKHKVIQDRADMLGIQHVYVGPDSKLGILNKWMEKLGIELSEVAYIGDDINDLDIMEAVGLTACPADAVKEIKKMVNIILCKRGGEGCIRELVDEWMS
ncbi:MAG: HAD-IIIA family hydrolase [Crocinitomicaceae bacterium]|nr:HAD-IIIA family hydrolase [Crocinitomicaceae bacterium]